MMNNFLNIIYKWLLQNNENVKWKFFVYISIISILSTTLFVFWAIPLSVYYAIATCILLFSVFYLNKFEVFNIDDARAISIFSLIGVSFVSMLAFESYYSADMEIFCNADHHGLALKGFGLKNNGILYGSDKNAIIEDSNSVGVIHYSFYKNDKGKVDSIELTLENFKKSAFVKGKNSSFASNQNSYLREIPVDGSITFENSSNNRKLDIRLSAAHESPHFYSASLDTALYIFTLHCERGTEIDTSAYHGFIQKSYPLEDIIPSRIAAHFGSQLHGFYLTRSQYNREEGARTNDNYFFPFLSTKKSFRSHPFILEQNKDADISIAVGTFVTEQSTNSIKLKPNDEFFVSFGENGSRSCSFNEDGQLLYDLPITKPIPTEDGINHVRVSTSDHTICATPKEYNIYHPTSQGEGNGNLYHFSFSFVKGHTNQPISFVINNKEEYKSNEDFLIETGNGNKAILSFTNFKEQSLFDSYHFYVLLIILMLLASLSLMINHDSDVKNNIKFAPVTELACLSLLIVLFTTRYILCWRESVFQPFDGISKFEYDKFFVNQSVFFILEIVLPMSLLFFLILKAVLLYKNNANRIGNWLHSIISSATSKKSRKTKKTASYEKWPNKIGKFAKKVTIIVNETMCCFRKRKAIISAGIILLVVFLELILSFIPLFPGLTKIIIPIVFFFFIELIITRSFVETSQNGLPAATHLLGRPFMLNFFMHLVLFFVLDKGFGVMFFFFGVIRYYLLFCSYLIVTTQSNAQNRLKWFWKISANHVEFVAWSIVIGLLSVVLVFCYILPTILALAMDYWWFGIPFLGIILGGVLFFGVWLFESLSMRLERWMNLIRNQLKVASMCLLVGVGLVFAFSIYDKTIGPNSNQIHIRYRTKVFVEKWDDILSKEKMTNAKNVSRFRQTSENQWILDYYYNNRNSWGDGYFKLLPQNKTGAMWGAQTTDISFLRYGIAEHGMSFAIMLFVLLFVTFIVASRQPRDPGNRKQIARRNIAVGAILLILIQSVFIWMSVTNRFVFFGQDFPMLSITSQTSVGYFMALLFIAILLLIPEAKAEDPSIGVSFKKAQKQITWIFTGGIVIFCALVFLFVGSSRENKNKASYNLSLSDSTVVDRTLEQQNKLLKYFQMCEDNENASILNKKILEDKQLTKNHFLNFCKYIVFNDSIIPSTLTTLLEETLHYGGIDVTSDLGQAFDSFAKGQKSSIHLEPTDSSYILLEFVCDTEEREGLNKINQLFVEYQIQDAGSRHQLMSLFNKNTLDNEVQRVRAILENPNLSDFIQRFSSFVAERSSNDSIVHECLDSLDKIPNSSFVKSLFEVYKNDLSKSNNTSDIIYIKRSRKTNYLEFAINKNYFHIPNLTKSMWKGNIVSNENKNNSTYKHDNNSIMISIDKSWLPSAYPYNNVYAIGCKPSKKLDIMLDGIYKVQLSQDNYTSLRISKNDNVFIGGTTNVIEIPESNDNVFARNVWFNGHRRMIFPLGKKFFWIKPYSQYLSEVMQDSSLVKPSALKEDHRVSLDYKLIEEIYDIMVDCQKEADEKLYTKFTNYFEKKNKDINLSPKDWKHNFSVFIGNSDGQIIALSDIKDDNLFNIDPNDYQALKKIQLQIDLFGDYSDERSINGNYNLMPLMYGPGSSLKPLTFAAVSSSYQTDWNKLRLIGVGENDKTINYFTRYAGKDFRKGEYFRSLAGDEPKKDEEFTVSMYLSESSNFFNSVISFMGLFPADSLTEEVFNQHIENRVNDFPIIRKDGKIVKFGKLFGFRQNDQEPIIKCRFYDNYGIFSKPLQRYDTSSYRAYVDMNSLEPRLREGIKRRGTYNNIIFSELWITPEPSYLDFPLWSDQSEISYCQKIKTITLGARRIVNITPLKMAESYARLFLLNNKFHYTISDEVAKNSVSFKAPAYKDDYSKFLKDVLQGSKSLYVGMNDCAKKGTANYLNISTKDSIYVYAKTGTINSEKDPKLGFTFESGLLSIIITNGDMTKVSIKNKKMMVNDKKPLKFYVIYLFTDKVVAHKKGEDRISLKGIKEKFHKGVFQKVLESHRFKKFIKEN